jgi:hypothetical protein
MVHNQPHTLRTAHHNHHTNDPIVAPTGQACVPATGASFKHEWGIVCMPQSWVAAFDPDNQVCTFRRSLR